MKSVTNPIRFRPLMAAAMLTALAACNDGLDFDVRDGVGGFDTTGAALASTAPRPLPDNRGVISYPGYQVAVSQRGDTVAGVATRLGLDAAELARFNGLTPNVTLREGEILALPTRVAEPSAATGAVDIAGLANAAIDAAPQDTARPAPQVETAALPQTSEPIRHRVERGETAFTIARLYDVSVSSLAEWNGLDADLSVREGQFLLIPVVVTSADASITAPGSGSATPTPPSSTTPVPELDEPPNVPETDAPPAQVAAPADTGEFLTPVAGAVIRGYAPGRNEGVDFGAPAGTPVRATEAGTVAAITKDTSGVDIIVIRHDGDLLSVYTQVDDLRVERGDRVSRGQQIASVREGDPSFLHFEIRNGLESVDPSSFLDL